ncbi:kinase-like domain-containing protein [Aspergillus crustosus]
MLSALMRSLQRFPLRRAWTPLNFSNPNFGIIAPDQRVKEETVPGYLASRYYPDSHWRSNQGQISNCRQTRVWGYFDCLAGTRYGTDRQRSYVTLKIYVDAASMGEHVDDELKIYERISQASRHPGHRAVRPLIESFNIEGPGDKHQCLVHPPLFESIRHFLHRNPIQRLPTPILAFTLHQLFSALDHTECRVVHTDIKADNIMFTFADDEPFKLFEQEELQDPSPRKEEDGRTIYLSRELKIQPAKLGAPILCDFGSAAIGGIEHYEDIQPNHYRAPEVILEAPWSYSADIWNVGCMIWNIFEGGSLFTGHDPESQAYKSKAHLAELIDLFGPPPASLLACGKRSERFFSETGNFLETSLLKEHTPLEKRETTLD